MNIFEQIERIEQEQDGEFDMYHADADDTLTQLVAAFLKQRFPNIKVREVSFMGVSEKELVAYVDDSIISWVEVGIEQVSGFFTTSRFTGGREEIPGFGTMPAIETTFEGEGEYADRLVLKKLVVCVEMASYSYTCTEVFPGLGEGS